MPRVFGILNRYIAAHVVLGTAVTLAVLVALFTIIELVDDFGDIGRGEYSLALAIEYSLLQIPGRMFELLPISALIGSILGLGILSGTSELIAMRAGGVTVNQITVAVLEAALVMVAISFLLGELVVPKTERIAYERRSVAISKDIALESRYGLWMRDGQSFINIRKVLPDARLADIYIYEFDDDYRLRVTTHARSAEFTGQAWRLRDIEQSEISDEGVVSRRIAEALWRSLLGPDQIAAVPIRPEALSVLGLVRYLRYLQGNGLNSTRYVFALWNKFVYPLSALVMVFVSAVLVLGPLRWMTLGPRLLTGVVVGIVFYIVQQTSMQMGLVYEAAPYVPILGPPLAFLGLGLWTARGRV